MFMPTPCRERAAGHLVSAGWDVNIWDVGTAQLLHTLHGDEDHAHAAAGPHRSGDGAAHPFTHVYMAGDLLAGGKGGGGGHWARVRVRVGGRQGNRDPVGWG